MIRALEHYVVKRDEWPQATELLAQIVDLLHSFLWAYGNVHRPEGTPAMTGPTYRVPRPWDKAADDEVMSFGAFARRMQASRRKRPARG
jgi:hypothetical protein